jgi:hypothetical protein
MPPLGANPFIGMDADHDISSKNYVPAIMLLPHGRIAEL